MSFWETNSAILRKKYPGLVEGILQNGNDAECLHVEVSSASSGAPTLVVNGLHVHSPRDPAREAERLASGCLAGAVSANAAVVILGFGLGYAAEAIAAQAPQRPIIIVEKNAGLLRKALELRDLSGLLSKTGVAFIPGGSGEGITAALAFFEENPLSGGSAGEKRAPLVIRNRTLAGLDEQWYAAVESRISAWAMRDDVNQATLKKFGRCWIRNLSRNISAIRDLPGVARLAGLAAAACSSLQSTSIPVFLAAAGPSLDSIAPLLPKIRERCIIVAVDTSLRFLLRNGIDPDFTLVVDPQFWNSCHLNRCAGPRTRLIVESAVYPPVLRLPFAGYYLCGSLFPLGNFIEKRVDPKGHLGAGGSVATAAWDFARILGPQQIWIAGLDLAFPGLKTHFKGAQFEEKALSASSRLNPAETWLVHALRDGIPFYAPATGGGQVLTDRRLSLYAVWFEENFRRFPGIQNYSLSTGGLAIKGLELAGQEAFLALPERRAEIDRRLDAALCRIETGFFEPKEARQRGERYEKAVAALVSGLKQIQDACVRGKKIVEQALQQCQTPGQQEKTLSNLDEINGFITGSEVKEIAGFLFPPEIVAAMGKTGQSGSAGAAYRAYLESSLRLYHSLAESAAISAFM